MKIQNSPALSQLSSRHKGFAIVISLTLTALLVVITIGLLTISRVALSSSSRSQDLAEARANARLALSMAINQLQQTAGRDQVITMTADQLPADSEGASSSAATDRRFWTGVYKAWPADSTTRPEPEFIRWLVSGENADLRQVETARQSGNAKNAVELVGAGTLGSATDQYIRVSPNLVQGLSGGSARIAWWTGDQGVKAAVSAPPRKTEEQEDLALASVRASLQSANATNLSIVGSSANAPFGGITSSDERLPRVVSWSQSELLAQKPESVQPYFHDLAASSSGLLVNVRTGGFRRDLSMYLEKPTNKVPTEPLYRVAGQDGINMSELWLHYNMYKELKTGSRQAYTTGGSIDAGSPFLQVEGSMAQMLEDPENFYKQPSFISYQTVISFTTRPVTVGGQAFNRLAMVIDPIITYWNPLDVPVSLSPAYNSTKFWQLPYDITIRTSSRTITASLMKILGGGAYHYLTLISGKDQPIVMKPGEVLMVSQGPNTSVTSYSPNLNYVSGLAGWNYGGGIAIDIRDDAGAYIDLAASDTIRYEVAPNSQDSRGTRHWSLNHHETYYKEDRSGRGESVGIGGVFIDYIYGTPHDENNPKPDNLRLKASSNTAFFGKIPTSQTRPLSVSQLANSRKEPIMMYSYNVKTEQGSDRGTSRFLQRFNPKAMLVDFYDLSEAELDVIPFEVQIQPLDSWRNRNLEVSPQGNGYFGGGFNRELGTSFVSTHSVPREPLYSLASLQHAFANGFPSNSAQAGYAIINARSPMLPHVSHPIGNSLASSVIPPNRTESSLPGGPRVLADHAYLANQALWDDWFFSGIAPQQKDTFSNPRNQRQVALDFLKGTTPLPVVRYLADTNGNPPDKTIEKLFNGTTPSDDAVRLAASLIRVDGLFNVNSTSVEAWKALLSSLKGRPVIVRDPNGKETLSAGDDATPISNLFSPADVIASGNGSIPVEEPNQWIGRRTLTDEEVDAFARQLVREVRKRGPFLSLADFVNRRVSSDKKLAISGAIQSALDNPNVPINQAYLGNDRVAQNASRFAFPEAESGPAAMGIPGIVKQADILTPIAPVLSVRSDSFLIRTYGESVDRNGKVLARAWCEAVVERSSEFVDANDPIDTATADLSITNQNFGRRFRVTSFRWLHPDEV